MQVPPVLSVSYTDKQKWAIYCFHKMIVDIFSGERVKRHYNVDGGYRELSRFTAYKHDSLCFQD